MKQKYHGTVSGQCMGIVYENWYDDTQEAIKDLRRKARKLVRDSFEEQFSAWYTLTLGGTVIASREVPLRGLQRIWKNYPGTAWHGYGFMTIGGVRIC